MFIYHLMLSCKLYDNTSAGMQYTVIVNICVVITVIHSKNYSETASYKNIKNEV